MNRSKQTVVTMKTIIVVWLIASACASFRLAEAQQPVKVPRIGFLTGLSASDISARIEAFRQGLREFGYIEGKTIVIEYRNAEGRFDRTSTLAGRTRAALSNTALNASASVSPRTRWKRGLFMIRWTAAWSCNHTFS